MTIEINEHDADAIFAVLAVAAEHQWPDQATDLLLKIDKAFPGMAAEHGFSGNLAVPDKAVE